MTTRDERLDLIDVLASGDSQDWPHLYENPQLQHTANIMYGGMADELLASSWLADRDRVVRRAALDEAVAELETCRGCGHGAVIVRGLRDGS